MFPNFNHLKVLIIGDVMLDSYVWGKVERISPEAPVPVVNVLRKEQRLGGAANVALNVKALGAKAILCSVVGQDTEGETLCNLLTDSELAIDGIVKSKTRITTNKERIIAGTQQIVRIDTETDQLITQEEQDLLLAKIKLLISDCQVVIFQDYDKGVLSKTLISEIVTLAKAHNIPTVVDPKKRNFWHYEGTTLFKPNLKELKEGLKIDFDTYSPEALEKVVTQFKTQLSLQGVFVTLSSQGVYIDFQDKKSHQPAHIRQIADVSGAGDTVISVAACCVALGLSPELIAGLANLAGGLVCEHAGVVPIDKNRLEEEAKKYFLGF